MSPAKKSPAAPATKRRASRKKPVALAIIGTGGMAHRHAEMFQSVPGCRIVAACDVDAERVGCFAQKFGIAQTFSSAKELLRSAPIDAVSIVAPDAFHKPLAMAALQAGKHVLCEKPLALTYPDAQKMARAAQRAGVVNMVNFSYRDWPCLQGLEQAVSSGRIGTIRHLEASYLQSWLPSRVWGEWQTSPQWLWRLSTSHGSRGVLGDVGVHILDFATYPAGSIREISCRLKSFPKSAPGAEEYSLDANDSAVMTVEFHGGALGVIHASRWAGGHANRLFLKICGTLGSVEIDSERSTTAYRLSVDDDLHKARWRDVECPDVPHNYAKFIRAIATNQPASPDFQRGAEIQKLLDACFESEASRQTVIL